MHFLKEYNAMSNIPAVTAVTARYRTPLFLILIAAGLAGNYFRFPLFLNIDFLFGSIFAMLALQLFGLGRGIAAAAMIASLTYFLWNHPYAIIIMTAEVAVVGLLMERRKMGMVLADTLYWLVIGMPLVFLFYYLVMHVSPSTVFIAMIKQAVNGIANALVARLLFIGFALRSRSSQTSFKEIVYNLLAFFVLCPALILLAAGSRTDFREIESNIRTTLTQNIGVVKQRLDTWVFNRKLAILNLAEMAASRTPEQMQPSLEQAKKSDLNFFRVGLLDRTATITAYVPLVDEQGKSNIGINTADRPYLPLLKQTLKPMLSEVLMGRVGIPEPRVFMLAPVVDRGEFGGYTIGVLSLEQIRTYLDKNSDQNTTLYTLIDTNGKVIMSNRSDQTMMTPFVRDQGTLTSLDAKISQWVPILPANVSVAERWKKSSYIAEITLGDLAEWKLILEQPVAPFQKTLYDNYAGKLTLLFLILLISLALAEILSRWSIVTLEKLSLVTHDLPTRLTTEGKEIVWPKTGIKEANHLIYNFKEMADSLTAQFSEIRQYNETLEQRVEERTAELRASEERFSMMFRKHTAIMFLIEPETGDIIDVNCAAVRFYEYPREILLTMNIRDINTHPPDAIKTERSAALAEQRNFFIFPHKKASGAMSMVEVHSTPITVHNTTLLFSIIHDITERKQMEEALQTTQERLELVMKATPDAIWDWDLLTDTIYYSPRWWTMVGYELNELAADTSLWQRLIHPDDLEQANQIFYDAIDGEANIYEIKTRRQHKQGHYVPILTRGFIQRDSNGKAVRISGLNTDLTDRQRTEEIESGLAKQLQLLEKTESLNRMAGAIAHNFNNILGAAIGYLELAIEDLPPEENASKFLTSAFKATERAAEISGMMLTYLGQGFAEHTDLDLSEVCRNSLPALQGLIQKDVILASSFPNPGPIISANASQMQRLLRNLVLNASEAILDKQGTITLTIMTASAADISTLHRFPVDWQPQDELYACLLVKDTGSGIVVKVFETLFDPFFTTKFVGRGLGLAVVSGILRSHRGVATVESEPDRGSVFRVYLPLSKEHLILQPETVAHSSDIGAGKTVLVVEDEQPLREMLETTLIRLGFVVYAASDGIEAIDKFREHQSDINIVLCDISMPGMDGWETLANLRTMAPGILVIFTSGHDEAQVMQSDKLESPQAFLQKPFKKQDLQRVLKTLLPL